MSGQYGTKETKEVMDLGFALGNAWKNAKKDGKIDVTDVVYLLGVVQVAPAAIKDVSMVPKELGEMDSVEALSVLEYAKQEIDGLVDDEQAKKVANAALKLGLAAAELVSVL